MVALSCAHGHAQVSGRAQAVLVHVECGTQSLAGAVHNAAKGRVPVFIFAGTSPFTQEGELKGSRNEFIQWIQDVPDQRGIVRQYMKYENELRTAKNVKQIAFRALQIARSDPKGPVYVVGAREVMEERTDPIAIDPADWRPVTPMPLPADGVSAIVDAVAAANRPLVVTSYLGRQPAAVAELVCLLPAPRRRRARICAELRQLPARRPALPGQPLEPPVPECRPGRGRCHPGDRQRRAVDTDGQQAFRRRRHLPPRRRPPEAVDAALVHPARAAVSRPTRPPRCGS
jgi:hypothetical protein